MSAAVAWPKAATAEEMRALLIASIHARVGQRRNLETLPAAELEDLSRELEREPRLCRRGVRR